MSKHTLALALAALAMIGNAWAHPEGSGRTVHGPDVETTGTVKGGLPAWSPGWDGQGRDLRSSTRGNAQFPERSPEAQNLGGTSGGPAF